MHLHRSCATQRHKPWQQQRQPLSLYRAPSPLLQLTEKENLREKARGAGRLKLMRTLR